jgi:hypothetical protein
MPAAPLRQTFLQAHHEDFARWLAVPSHWRNQLTGSSANPGRSGNYLLEVITMFSTQQLEMLRKALDLVRQADQIVIQARLPALASGVREVTRGLSMALEGLTMIVRDR